MNSGKKVYLSFKAEGDMFSWMSAIEEVAAFVY